MYAPNGKGDAVFLVSEAAGREVSWEGYYIIPLLTWQWHFIGYHVILGKWSLGSDVRIVRSVMAVYANSNQDCLHRQGVWCHSSFTTKLSIELVFKCNGNGRNLKGDGGEGYCGSRYIWYMWAGKSKVMVEAERVWGTGNWPYLSVKKRKKNVCIRDVAKAREMSI